MKFIEKPITLLDELKLIKYDADNPTPENDAVPCALACNNGDQCVQILSESPNL